MTKDKIVLMGYAIQDNLININLSEAKPKDLMKVLIEKGYFDKDHRNGLPLRNILRDLDDTNELYLLPQVRVKILEKNRNWFFSPLAS